MSTIARTAATGAALDPRLLAFSTSLPDDRTFAREDVLGSAAHATMLGRTGLIPKADAQALRTELLALYTHLRDGGEGARKLLPPGEEDVHMAVEAYLAAKLGTVAGRLHTARSRNDQVALDLRLYVRGAARAVVEATCDFVATLADRGEHETETLLPAYTHRQRAQPVSFGFYVAAWCAGLVRAIEVALFALDRTGDLPLGSGACSGTSLGIDRALIARLLGFPRITVNALDTVGDRDFALDWAWAGERILLALGKIAADITDLSTQEFAMVKMDGSIATGSSMMPQKKNPDVFELVRSKSALGAGDVMTLLALVKGLPSGYNRDQQDDRRALLAIGPRVLGAIEAMSIAVPRLELDADRGRAAVSDGATQATDLAEALVRKGVPFREAYTAVGTLVRDAASRNVQLTQLTAEQAARVHSGLDAAALAALDPDRAMRAKKSAGGTAPERVREQLAAAKAASTRLRASAATVPSLDAIARAIGAEPL